MKSNLEYEHRLREHLYQFEEGKRTNVDHNVSQSRHHNESSPEEKHLKSQGKK